MVSALVVELEPQLTAGGIVLDPATRTALRAGRTIDLTPKEYSVLEYLMVNAGTVISTHQLINHSWETSYQGMSNVVPTYIRYLRRKLSVGGEPDVIQTRRGCGYLIPRDR